MVIAYFLSALATSAAGQQTYPNKPIRLIVPYAQGGASGAVANLVSQKLSEAWGQPVLIVNRPGGNTVIGSEAVAKAAPDGYTVLLTSTSHVTLPSLLSTLPFDSIKDFSPVATLASGVVVLVVDASVPATNLKDFIAYAKLKPGQLNYGTAGAGTTTHLASELFNIMAGVKTQHIAYKGSGAVITDLLGGQIQLAFQPVVSITPHVASGKLKALASSGEMRAAALPLVPTFIEAGLPGYEVKYWYGILAPVGMPKDLVNKMSDEIAKILAMQEVKNLLTSQGMDPFVSSSEQFAALLRADMDKYAKIIKTADIKAE